MRFIKASACDSNACVEVAIDGVDVWIRHSDQDPQESIRFNKEEWRAFLKGARSGEFDV